MSEGLRPLYTQDDLYHKLHFRHGEIMAQKQWFKLLQVTLQVSGAVRAKPEPCWDLGWCVSLSTKGREGPLSSSHHSSGGCSQKELSTLLKEMLL